jgi:hypothetical protein
MPLVSYAHHEPVKPGDGSNCRGRLLAFGVVLVVLGGIAGFLGILTALLPLLGWALTPTRTPAAGPHSLAADAGVPLLIWGAIATVMIWTGVASIRLRRWCRPIVLGVSGFHVAFGIITLLVMAALYATAVPTTTSSPIPMRRPSPRGTFATPAPPPVSDDTVQLLVAGGILLVEVAIPLMFFLAYIGAPVRRTLDEADPMLGWSDRCPVPVLALAIGLAWVALFFFAGLFALPPLPAAAGRTSRKSACFSWAG